MLATIALGAALGLALSTMANIGAASPQTLSPSRTEPEAGVDIRIQPGDDFFAYANGAWLESTAIPEGAARWGARNEIDARTQEQVAVVIREVATRTDNAARKVADFHSAYLDEAAIERRGLTPISTLMEGIAGIANKPALSRWLGRHLRADVDPLDQGIYVSSHLFGLSVQHGIHGEPANFAYLLQGGLALGDREQYLSDATPARERRGRYRQHIARMLELAGFDDPGARAAAVLDLEIAIARTHATEEASANERNADRHWSKKEFATRAPGLDWTGFFAAAGLAEQTDFVVWQPDAIQGTASLVGSETLGAWQDYLRFQILNRFAEVLPQTFASEYAKFHEGDGKPRPRTDRAVEATNRFLPKDVGRLYVDRYFSFAVKANVQATVANVLGAFRRRVESAPWMTADTKETALAKLDTMYFGVGYPEKWPDDSGLRIDRDAAGNLQRIADWNYRSAVARLGRPVDRNEWSIAPQSPVAVLNFLQNSYNFSAALLQPPKFDPAASDASNYGAIGAIVGHEISHFVDTLGAEYDAHGALNRWWTPEDSSRYAKACEGLVKQFSNYRALAELPVNGTLTLSENAADLAGLTAAFDAHRRALGSRADDPVFRRQQDRQFFIGFARAWRAKITIQGIRTQVATNVHAPENFRVSTVRNLDAWYEAFDVQPDQRLYLPPQSRERLW